MLEISKCFLAREDQAYLTLAYNRSHEALLHVLVQQGPTVLALPCT